MLLNLCRSLLILLSFYFWQAYCLSSSINGWSLLCYLLISPFRNFWITPLVFSDYNFDILWLQLWHLLISLCFLLIASFMSADYHFGTFGHCIVCLIRLTSDDSFAMFWFPPMETSELHVRFLLDTTLVSYDCQLSIFWLPLWHLLITLLCLLTTTLISSDFSSLSTD